MIKLILLLLAGWFPIGIIFLPWVDSTVGQVLLCLTSFQAIRCILGFVLRFTWHPPAVQQAPIYTDYGAVYKRAEELIPTLSTDKYGLDDDSAKFLYMKYVATGDDGDWNTCMRLVGKDGDMKRSLTDPYPVDGTDFSTDMMAGMLPAVAKRLPKLTSEERTLLSRVWDKATWEGLPMVISTENKGKVMFGRGHVWRWWWVIGSEEILTALTWLEIGYRLTGSWKYRVMYWLFWLFQLPAMILADSDAQIWIGKVYQTSTHNTHSKTMVFRCGYDITGSLFMRLALNKAYKRHGDYCADIAILAGEIAAPDCYWQKAMNLTANAMSKGKHPCPEDTTYYTLFPPEKVIRASMLMLPVYRGNDYVWERSAIKGSVKDANYRQTIGLDVIFPALLLKERDPAFDH